MSMLRKTVLTTAIIGAGLASTTGAAFAGDCPTDSGKSHSSHDSHGKSHEGSKGGCSNAVDAHNSNGSGDILGGIVTGGSQNVSPSNVCGNFSNNQFLSNNNVSLFGNVHNGDTKEVSKTDSKVKIIDIAKSF
ncbi:hypothetical protein [Actinomycetospora termitidis]|uniref:Secreted protein n=1 Tax=Actinomycetospora termitidis TaxID=3053470 RepID=A0ABT7M6Z9_9PSEU|nr:hypothetical protein [Actinomycetospora sp. Odt1-22]MDL5155582.1 hypothetical protein [Actinomycetospora sp. Odt1-22]